MKRITNLLLWAFILIAAGCKKDNNKPGNNHPRWVTYHTANSRLPDNQVNAIAIGPDDVTWIGTAKGLVRISGDSWTVFNTGNSSLPSSHIRALAVENDGTVWIGTDRGLARYNPTGWQVYTNANSVLTSNGIMAIAHDEQRGITWIATEKGLVKAAAGSQWQNFDELSDHLILSLAVDGNGALWLGTFNHFAFRGAIKKFDNGQWTSFQLDALGYPSTFPYGLAIDKSNSVFAVLTGTSVRSVIQLNGNSWQELKRPETATGLRTILLEGDTVWVGGNQLSVFGDKPSVSLSVPGSGSHIHAMAMDSKSRKWLGTVDGGVAVYDAKGR